MVSCREDGGNNLLLLLVFHCGESFPYTSDLLTLIPIPLLGGVWAIGWDMLILSDSYFQVRSRH